MHKTRLILVAAVALISTAAFGQQGDRVIIKKKTFIDIDEHLIEAHPDSPAGAYTLVHPKTRFKSLMTVRGNFVPELQRSVDNL